MSEPRRAEGALTAGQLVGVRRITARATLAGGFSVCKATPAGLLALGENLPEIKLDLALYP
jgi:hypothetical protein